jgi:hypothetical protein
VDLFGIFEEVSARMHGTEKKRGGGGQLQNFERNFRKLQKRKLK